MMLTATAEESEGSGAEDDPGGAVAGVGATSDETSKEAAATGAGGCHRAKKRERERVTVWQENPVGHSSGVGEREGVPEASVVAENLGGGGLPGSGRGI